MKKYITVILFVTCTCLMAHAQKRKEHAGLYANFSIKTPYGYTATNNYNHYDLALSKKKNNIFVVVFESNKDSGYTERDLFKLLEGTDDSLRKAFGDTEYPVMDIIEKKIVKIKNIPTYTVLYTTLISGVGLVHHYHLVQIHQGKYFEFRFGNIENDLPAFIKESNKIVESLIYPTKAPVRKRERNELLGED